MSMTETEMLLKGYGLTTAEFFYRMPDHPLIIAPSLVLQHHDVAPDFPWLFGKIEWWQSNLDGPLHSVRFTHRRMLTSTEVRIVSHELHLEGRSGHIH